MTAYIESIGVISCCAQSYNELVRVLNGGEYTPSSLPIEFTSNVPSAKMRRNSRYNKLACAAAEQAVSTAGIPEDTDRHRIGTIISTAYGSSVNYSAFTGPVIKNDPKLCTPSIYSGMVPNSCVGQICILNGFKGVSTVLVGGDPLEYSLLQVATNKADMILCGSIDEYNADLYNELGRLGTLKGCELSEGTAMLMLIRAKTDRTLCSVSGTYTVSLGASPLLNKPDNSAADVIEALMKRYDKTPDSVFTAANGTYFDETESMTIRRVFPDAVQFAPKKLTGETLGCGYMLNAAVAAAAVGSGKYGRVLVTGYDIIGNYSAAMLERV